MNGSVLVLLGCFALFFAAPSHSHSVRLISEDGQLPNRRDTESGSSTTEATTSGDAVGETDTPAGESITIGTGGSADPGIEPVSEDAKSKVRKRDTRSMVRDMTVNTDEATSRPVSRDLALYLFRLLGEYGGMCFRQMFNLIQYQEWPADFRASRLDGPGFTRSDMVRLLQLMHDSMSECLKNTVDLINLKLPYDDDDTPISARPSPGSDELTVSEFLSWFTEIGKMLQECFGRAIKFLKAYGPGDTVQGSSGSFADYLAEPIPILSQTGGAVFAAGHPTQMFLPGYTVSPYLDSLPIITTYRKRSSLYQPRIYPHFSNLPAYTFQYPPNLVYTPRVPDQDVAETSGFSGERAQLPDTTGINTLLEDVTAPPTGHVSLLNTVLDQIYSHLQYPAYAAENMDAAPVEDLRVDGNGALGSYPGNGERLAEGNTRFSPDFVNRVNLRVNKRRAH